MRMVVRAVPGFMIHKTTSIFIPMYIYVLSDICMLLPTFTGILNGKKLTVKAIILTFPQ